MSTPCGLRAVRGDRHSSVCVLLRCRLLVDEDTAATNFMIRSAAMQRLVAPEKEPITPFIAKVRALADSGPEGGSGVSSILVLGGSGDYFAVADTVIAMESVSAEPVGLGR